MIQNEPIVEEPQEVALRRSQRERRLDISKEKKGHNNKHY